MRVRHLAVIASLFTLLALVRVADAQSAEAETLFREGKRLVKEGKIAEGCDKLAASERLESSTGTLLNLGDCREKNGQLATAWAAFTKGATTAKRDKDTKRETEARRRAGLLEGRLGKLEITVPTHADGLVVKRNDQTIDPALWNTEVPVDAGSYKITATAPGFAPFATEVTAVDGQKVTAEIKLARPGEVKPQPVKPPVVTTKPTTKPTPPDEDHGAPEEPEETETPSGPGTFTTLRKASLGLAVLGAGGIVLGAVYGSKAKDLHDQANKICPMPACNDPHAVDLNDDAKSKAKLANVGFIVGGVAVAGAVALWFVGAPKTESHAVAIVPTSDGITFTMAGRF